MKKLFFTILIACCGCEFQLPFFSKSKERYVFRDEEEYETIQPHDQLTFIKKESFGNAVPYCDRVMKLVFYTRTNRGLNFGTGFFVSHNDSNYLITVNHIFKESNRIMAINNGESLDIIIDKVSFNKNDDLVVVRIKNNISGYKLLNSKKSINELYKDDLKEKQISLYGYSETWGYKEVKTSISDLIEDEKKDLQFACFAKSDYGMSGGPAIDEYDRIVGYIVAKAKTNRDIVIVYPVTKIIKAIESMEIQ